MILGDHHHHFRELDDFVLLFRKQEKIEKKGKRNRLLRNPLFSFLHTLHDVVLYQTKLQTTWKSESRWSVCKEDKKKSSTIPVLERRCQRGGFEMSTTNELGRKSRMNRRNAKDDSKEIVK